MWFLQGHQFKDHRFASIRLDWGQTCARVALQPNGVEESRSVGRRAFPWWNYQIPVAKLFTLLTSLVNSCCGLTSRRWYSNQPPLGAPLLPWPRGQLPSVLLGLVLTTRCCCCAFTTRPELQIPELASATLRLTSHVDSSNLPPAVNDCNLHLRWRSSSSVLRDANSSASLLASVC